MHKIESGVFSTKNSEVAYEHLWDAGGKSSSKREVYSDKYPH